MTPARFGTARFDDTRWDVDSVPVYGDVQNANDIASGVIVDKDFVSGTVQNRNDIVVATIFDEDFVTGVVKNRDDVVTATIFDEDHLVGFVRNADDVVECKMVVTLKKKGGGSGLYIDMPHIKQWWEREEEKVEEALEAIEQEIEQELPMLAMPQPPQIDPATQRMIQALMRRGTHHMDVADEDDIEAILQFL